MNTTIRPARQDPPSAPPAAPPRRDEPGRVQHLFRVMTRLGLVHPLQHLILRYRAGEQA